MFELASNLLLGGLGFLSVITLVVFVHELGHFLAGRFFGVKIDSFSIGFGREVLGFNDRHGTRWKIGWLPLGGYVKFWGDDGVSSTPDRDKLDKASSGDRSKSFHHKPLYQKSIIAVAGPVANFALAIFVLSSLFLIYGIETDSPRIGGIKKGYPAEAAGLQVGDLVLEIDSRAIKEFDDIVKVVTVSDARPLDFLIVRGEQKRHLIVTPRMIPKPDNFGDRILDPGIGIQPVYPGEIKTVTEGSPAAISGLRTGDIIGSANGKYMSSLKVLAKEIQASEGKPIELLVSRTKGDAKESWDREAKTFQLVPHSSSNSLLDTDKMVFDSTGIRPVVAGAPESKIRVTFGPIGAVSRATAVTEFIVVKTIYFIGQLLTGTGDYRQLSGPVGIASVSGKVAVEFGVVPLINLAAVLSVSIGLLNLFPIPMLDGGHILYYGIEAVRGRPLGEWAQELGFRIGLAFVVCLLLFATWNDLTKLGVFGFLSFSS